MPFLIPSKLFSTPTVCQKTTGVLLNQFLELDQIKKQHIPTEDLVIETQPQYQEDDLPF